MNQQNQPYYQPTTTGPNYPTYEEINGANYGGNSSVNINNSTTQFINNPNTGYPQQPLIVNPQPVILNPKPVILNPQPQVVQPVIVNPQPQVVQPVVVPTSTYYPDRFSGRRCCYCRPPQEQLIECCNPTEEYCCIICILAYFFCFLEYLVSFLCIIIYCFFICCGHGHPPHRFSHGRLWPKGPHR